MLQNIGKQSVNPCSHGEEEEEGYSGKDLQKTTALSLEWKSDGVMDDECDESMEPVKEVLQIV